MGASISASTQQQPMPVNALPAANKFNESERRAVNLDKVLSDFDNTVLGKVRRAQQNGGPLTKGVLDGTGLKGDMFTKRVGGV